jgi:hypothetical protein
MQFQLPRASTWIFYDSPEVFMLGRSTSARRQDAAEIPVSLASGDFCCHKNGRPIWTASQDFSLNTTLLCFHIPRTPLISLRTFFSVSTTEKKAKRSATWEYRGYSSGCDDGAHRHSERAFTTCFQDLQKSWQQCIDCGGNYFEGDR